MAPAPTNGGTASTKESQTARPALANLGAELNSTIIDNEDRQIYSEAEVQREWDKLAPLLRDHRNGETESSQSGGSNGTAKTFDGKPSRPASGQRPVFYDDPNEGNEAGGSSPRSNGSAGGNGHREPSPRRGQEKEKVLKLSLARMEELMSSPDSIPVRTLSNELNQKRTESTRPLLSIQTSEMPRADSKRSCSDAKSLPNHDPKPRSPKEMHLDYPPKFLVPAEHGPLSAPLGHRAQTSRMVSSPVPHLRRNSIDNESRLPQTTPARPKSDRPVPTHINIDDRNNLAISQIADPVPSPMPQSIPLPPLSIPTYLQLELSSSRPSPLYIHRSITSDFPYESSRVKIDRLLNFLFLPPALEQVLWFGALACLDSWLYSFTILPLRFVKALYILITSWGLNLSREIQFISGFIFKGVGRVWRRRNALAGQRGPIGASHRRAISGNGSAVKDGASDRDGRTRTTTARTDRRPRQSVSRKHRRQKSIPSALLPDDKADLLKGFLMIVTCVVLMHLDASRMYHWIRGQAAIKLYVIYNVLEVSDRLLSAIGQDVLECLFSREALERKPDGRSKVVRPFWLFILALCYTVLHATSLFYQVITLNVAVNSYSNALITLLLSNQFVEIKSTVFKKFEKENLFQLTCADVVERFQLWLMLTIIASRNIVETGIFSSWGSLGPGLRDQPATSTNSTFSRASSSILPQSFTLFPSSLFTSLSGANSFLPTIAQVLGPFLVVLGSEMLVDWLKHAYINKFNNTRPVIYSRFLDVLAKDYYTNAFADQNLTKRLGLPVIPLACLFFRVSVQTYQMFLAAWLPQHSPSTPNTTSLSSFHHHYSSLPSPSQSAPFSFKSAIPLTVDRISSIFGSVLNNALPSPARSIPVFTVILILTGYLILLLLKLAMGIILLSFARSRYKGMKDRESQRFFSQTSQTPQPPQPHGREYIVEGGRRVGGWGVVEVDDDKRRWIYADDPEGMKKLREREERDRNPKDSGPGFDHVQRYEMVAKRIW